MVNSEALSYGHAIARGDAGFPYTQVECRLANAYRSM
jgi:hypothetical protein